ncbi:hypothetical protein AKJ51_02235 [candidate division MSBL1 archaeon SCGC-AAA382A20]|uniref:Uncharacterized protein n=1 Tax=candidate division MSBL1 archaeon SCGC-AAA382A20 TaxID=1698280 RepID=A0A133VKR1_9EURY|nr:hypothetical protein AKJ51_02235 [candidate division MSBL1 archaeon SCGC-AAA382A20]
MNISKLYQRRIDKMTGESGQRLELDNFPCRHCEVADALKNGEVHVAQFEIDPPSLKMELQDEFDVVPALHAIEYVHERDFQPEKIEVEKLEGSNEFEEINITDYNPNELPRNYIVSYKRGSVQASELLEEYNEFLNGMDDVSFPFNLQMKGANREKLENVREKLEGKDMYHLLFGGGEGEKVDRIYFPGGVESVEGLVDDYSMYCINYKVRF